MKKVFFGITGAIFIVLSAWLGNYFYKKSKKDPIVYKTEKPFVQDIIKKSVATGSIVPRREVQVKPQVSGIIEELYVEAGERVKKGQIIARVRVVQNLDGRNRDMIGINTAQGNLQNAQINYNNAKIEHDRNKQLFDQKVISQQEFNRFKLDLQVRKQSLDAAKDNLKLTQQGALQRAGNVANDIFSTVDGILLDVPVRVGSSVIERNNFNEGTTIATVADMNNLVFEGKIDESEVGKIKEGMDLNLTIGAIEDKVFQAKLEYISPKGKTEEGAIKFDIRAKLILSKEDKLRAGYSANADIVLAKRVKVLAIKEKLLQFEKAKTKGAKDKPYVEVETGKQKFKRVDIKTGISDGINIEVVKGLKKTDKIKIPPQKKPKK
ncbi:MAG TPA: efflux transporter periplasmic adaptor subunit [Microscillaceae bacterium]|nr:efflux transporter periplasmic adaptor subunit [Microscillaceae bacterium]